MTSSDSTEPALRWPTTHEISDILAWLFAHLFCGLVPLWGSWLLLKLGKQAPELSDYVSHGEFCLYAAALAGPTLFVVLRKERSPLHGRPWIGLVAAALLVFSAFVFAVTFTFNYKSGGSIPLQLDIVFLARVSVVLYSAALVTAAVTYYLEALTWAFDPRKTQEKEQEALTEAFRSIED